MTERQITVLLIILKHLITEMRDLSSSLGAMSSYKLFNTTLDLLQEEFSEYFKE